MDYLAELGGNIHELRDARFDDWFLVSGTGCCTMIVLYALGLILGPKLMARRKAFELKGTMMVYNVVQIAYNAYMVWQTLPFYRLLNWKCAEVDYSDSPLAYKQATLVWLYYMNKYLDMVDTVFIVLRKKNDQLSFLHFYHHGTMVLIGWLAIRFLPGGHTLLLVSLNMIIHTVLYGYYLLSSISETVKTHQWKKLLTQAQLIQFMMGLIWSFYMSLTPSCNYPKGILVLILVQAVVFVSLFYNFYRHSYVKKSK